MKKKYQKISEAPAPQTLNHPHNLRFLCYLSLYKPLLFYRGEMYTGVLLLCYFSLNFFLIASHNWAIMKISNNICITSILINLERILEIAPSPIESLRVTSSTEILRLTK